MRHLGSRGFTLLEIMVVVFILGLLVTLVAPRIVGRADEARHTKAIADMKAVEQALKSGTCSAVLAWLEETKLAGKDIRRLKLSAKRGTTFAVLFRPERAAQRQSMAELRIRLHPVSTLDGLCLEILKRRGGWPTERLSLELLHRTARVSRLELREQLTLWRTRSRHSIVRHAAVRSLPHPQATHAIGP